MVHVCAEHKKPAKLLKHLATIREASAGLRNPPRVLVFANRIKVGGAWWGRGVGAVRIVGAVWVVDARRFIGARRFAEGMIHRLPLGSHGLPVCGARCAGRACALTSVQPHPRGGWLWVQAVRFLAAEVAEAGHRTGQLHGQRSQAEREEAVAAFRAGKLQASSKPCRSMVCVSPPH